VLTALANTLGCPYAELWLHDVRGDVLRPAAHWARDGFDQAPPLPDELDPGVGVVGVAWRRRQPVWVDDIHRDGLIGDTRGPVGGEPTPLRSAVVVPVHNAEDVHGAIILYSTAADRPSDTLALMLAGVASQFGQHLQHRRAEDLALQLARAKDEYIRLVGHELRTPLTSIAAYTDLLTSLGDDLPEDARQLLEVITRNSERLRRIIDALLDLAALDSGHATMHVVRFDLAATVRDAVADATPAADDWPVTLRAELPGEVPLDGDRSRLRHVLDTLLSNAITYSHPGGDVAVALTVELDRARITVADTGIGIPAEELRDVFERFHRSSRVRDLGIPGTGLGLATSRLVVDRHGGTIELQPTPGGGTTVTVCIPLRQPAANGEG
jgi:signal transduction histidine kinase